MIVTPYDGIDGEIGIGPMNGRDVASTASDQAC